MSDVSTNAGEWTVSELSGALKRTIETEFGHVRVRGEVSGYRGSHASGHCYFTLKDQNARLDAVIWKTSFARLKFKPEDGLEVIATGRITTFPGSSKYQIVIEALEPAGIGALMALLEERRRKLAAEGLFDEARKAKLPFLPGVIGVVTSPTGAVIRDILHRLADRFPRRVLVWPVRVQGETSAAEVAAAIAGLNALDPRGDIPRPDLIIVARGGGSLEDLWSFNEEIVVRAVAASAIPLISAIGHETDWTLLDHAADRRAPTPTGAAEMAVPVRAELAAAIASLRGRLASGALRHVERKRAELRAAERALPARGRLILASRQRLDAGAQALGRAAERQVERRRAGLGDLSRRLAGRSPLALLALAHQRLGSGAARLSRSTGAILGERRKSLDHAGRQLAACFAANLRRHRDANRLAASGLASLGLGLRRNARLTIAAHGARLAAATRLLGSVGYRSVLARGFVLVHDVAGAPVRSAAKVAAGDALTLEFADGRVGAVAGGLARPVRRRRGDKSRDAEPSLFE